MVKNTIVNPRFHTLRRLLGREQLLLNYPAIVPTIKSRYSTNNAYQSVLEMNQNI